MDRPEYHWVRIQERDVLIGPMRTREIIVDVCGEYGIYACGSDMAVSEGDIVAWLGPVKSWRE